MDKVPVDFATAERLTLGIDQMTLLATSAQTGDALSAAAGRRSCTAMIQVSSTTSSRANLPSTPEALARRCSELRRARVRLFHSRAVLPHTVRHETEEDAVALVVHAPGPPMENFSRAVAAASVDGIPDMNEVLAIAQRHGIELLGPIPALQR